MVDPLDVLRTPSGPVAPDPDFATRLRARIEAALTLPKGVAVTTTTHDQLTEASGAGSGALTPYLAVADARAAIDWYVATLDARRIGEPIVMPDGRVGHAELEVFGARIFLSDEHPEIGVSAPTAGSGAAVSLHLEVPDVDGITARAAAANASVEREPNDNPYGRLGVIRDPFGHRWMLSSPPAPPVGRARDGDVGLFSLWVDDVDRAAHFYAAVLGWHYLEKSGPRRTLVGTALPYRISALADARREFWPDQRRPTMFCSRGVDDLEGAVERVRAAGGQARERQRERERMFDCVDNQGGPFSLHENPPEAPRPPMSGAHHGDVAYLTMHVVDSGRARRFYRAVFGWTYSRGQVEDGWQIHGPAPMTGLHGGSQQATMEPMYRVDDIVTAVEQVRAAGGSATDPENRPYGITAHCSDDQGVAFYLGQL